MRLGFHYLRKGEKRSGRAIISVGSMASFTAVPTAPLYSATKAGVLGLVKSASDLSNGFLKDEGIRISMIAPFFARESCFLLWKEKQAVLFLPL